MKSNIDIDRISLEDRDDALEGRLPINGSSSASGAWLLNPKVIDSCRDNEITELNDGFVAKMDIPNFAALQASDATYPNYFNNLEMKIVMFFPLVNGIIMTCSQVFSRWRATENLSNLPTPRIGSISMYPYCPIQDWSKITSKFNFGSKTLAFSLHSPLSYPGDVILGNPAQSFAQELRLSISIGSERTIMDISMKGTSYSNNNYTFPDVDPSVAFGISMLPPFTPLTFRESLVASSVIGSSPSRPSSAGFTGAQPSDLPDHLRPSYPDSWYT